MNIFAKPPPPPKEALWAVREMTTATRGNEKEITSLELEENRLVAEIKRTAKTGKEARALECEHGLGLGDTDESDGASYLKK
ncbi:hypothetical protein IFM89_003165 [Coptis chinensis]|uniref:Uncharacterized protein n=1 Tax=Coptis chinensis TaxID=261450 RepID=A0A835I6X1_9MAGN|nr:hypothetical protein IFM89_003165 [Coptis chinensis]